MYRYLFNGWCKDCPDSKITPDYVLRCMNGPSNLTNERNKDDICKIMIGKRAEEAMETETFEVKLHEKGNVTMQPRVNEQAWAIFVVEAYKHGGAGPGPFVNAVLKAAAKRIQAGKLKFNVKRGRIRNGKS